MPDALSSDRKSLSGECWRVVEAQHEVSTLKLVDTLEDQAALEALIDATKPAIPPECRHLHYLLATPFRYGARYPNGSRFRRAGQTEGVYYASAAVETAISEMAFWRVMFYAESPETPWPSNPAPHTAFSVDYATQHAIDLTAAPFAGHGAVWTHPTDYAGCQELADGARRASIELIRYASVRDPRHRANVAILRCGAFKSTRPKDSRTWRLHLGETGVRAICAFPSAVLELGRFEFCPDPRLSQMRWRR